MRYHSEQKNHASTLCGRTAGAELGGAAARIHERTIGCMWRPLARLGRAARQCGFYSAGWRLGPVRSRTREQSRCTFVDLCGCAAEARLPRRSVHTECWHDFFSIAQICRTHALATRTCSLYAAARDHHFTRAPLGTRGALPAGPPLGAPDRATRKCTHAVMRGKRPSGGWLVGLGEGRGGAPLASRRRGRLSPAPPRRRRLRARARTCRPVAQTAGA